MNSAMKRLFSSTTGRSGKLGFALDIDGVFLKGTNVLPGAKEALRLLDRSGLPYVFVTNGGGVTEEDKARSLSQLLDSEVTEKMVLMSHTPFRRQVDQYRDKRVLVLGSENAVSIAKHYGFKKPVSPRDLLSESPTAFQQISVHKMGQHQAEMPDEEVHAALVIGDPFEWGLDIQILTDVMLSSSQIPLFASNADILYNNEHHSPRYTQGAFVAAFQYLYEKVSQQPLEVQFAGKPFAITYSMAQAMLEERSQELDVEVPKRFVGIGDSPMSDIRGANNFGWSSVLVHTGVWSPSASGEREIWEYEGNESMTPTLIKQDILEAVEALLRLED